MAKRCLVPNCERKVEAKGFCDLHYRRLRNKGTTDGPVLAKEMKCGVDGCTSLQHSKGYCRLHAERARKHGSPHVRLCLRGESAANRLMEYSEQRKNGCREWTGGKDKNGYGIVRVMLNGVSVRQAHRASYLVFVGQIPDGVSVLHRCDNPGCINPKHLFLGMASDNNADKSKKGRHPNARLNEDEVRAIRESNEARRILAERYGVSIGSIQQIKENRSYKHVTT